MRKLRSVVVAALISIAAVSPVVARDASKTRPAVILAWPNGRFGGARAHDLVTGARRFELPPGRADALNRSYFAATVAGNASIVRKYALDRGTVLLQRTLPGEWAVSGVAPNGAWVAVTRAVTAAQKRAWAGTQGWRTEVLILDADLKRRSAPVVLNGNFEVESIGNDGKWLFALQHQPAANPDHYDVRAVDLSTGLLDPSVLRTKEPEESMYGEATDSVASPDGNWFLTLYINTRKGWAFIHVLDMAQRFTGCVDLPSGDGDLNNLRRYVLSIDPSSRAIYAVNPVLGVVAELPLVGNDAPGYATARLTRFRAVSPSTNDVRSMSQQAWQYLPRLSEVQPLALPQPSQSTIKALHADTAGVHLLRAGGSVTLIPQAP
jgi:hypothetical protein